MKIKYLLLLFFFCSCATSSQLFNEEMLPDGTWKLSFFNTKQCQKISETKPGTSDPRRSFEKDEDFISRSSEEKSECLSFFKTQAEQRAKDLCPIERFRVFGCRAVQDQKKFSIQSIITCYIKC